MLLKTVERAELQAYFSYLARSLVHNFMGYGAHVNVSKREYRSKAPRH